MTRRFAWIACVALLPLRVVNGGARWTAAVARSGLVPVDDATWPPDVGPSDGLVGRRHLATRSVRTDRSNRHAEVRGDVAGRPPLGRLVRRSHAADGSAFPRPICAVSSLTTAQSMRKFVDMRSGCAH